MSVFRAKPALGLLLLTFVISGLSSGCDSDGIKQITNAEAAVRPSVGFLFPKTAVGDQAERVVTITNVGAATLRLIDIAGEFSTDFALQYQQPGSPQRQVGIQDGQNAFPAIINLESGESLSLVLVYTPLTNEPPSGRVFMETNDPQSNQLSIPISLSGTGAELVVAPTVLDLGRTVPGEEVRQTLLATNSGTANLDFQAINLNGSQDFRLEIDGVDIAENPGALADPDGDGSDGLVPNGSFNIDVIYNTPAPGPDSAEIEFVTNGVVAVVVVSLEANGISPCINVIPRELDFGDGLVGRNNPGALIIESCGLDPLLLQSVRIMDEDGVFIFEEESFPQLPTQLPPIDPTGQSEANPSRAFTMYFTPEEERAYIGTAIIESNDPVFPVVEVPLGGRGSQNECPFARVADEQFSVPPLDTVVLDGTPSTDSDSPTGRPLTYEWTVVQRPSMSTSEPIEALDNVLRPQDGGPPDDIATPMAAFFVDLAGEYIIELQVTDRLGAVAPSEQCPQVAARVRIVADPLADIHVQLVWNTPLDDDQTDVNGTDLDLHLRHPRALNWFDEQLDCSYNNPRPDWGVPNRPTDNPSLDIDDRNGAGPENINLDNPEVVGPYVVGVHYYRSTMANFGGMDFGVSDATVRIYLGGELREDHIFSGRLNRTNDFWEVGSIFWANEPENRSVTPIDVVREIDPFGE